MQWPTLSETMTAYEAYELLCVPDVWHGTFNNSYHFPRPPKEVQRQRDQKPKSREAKCEAPEMFVNGPLCLSSCFPKPQVVWRHTWPYFPVNSVLRINHFRQQQDTLLWLWRFLWYFASKKLPYVVSHSSLWETSRLKMKESRGLGDKIQWKRELISFSNGKIWP